MKICVLVPSDNSLTQAGVRIRYRRIEHALRTQGHELRVMAIQNIPAPAELADDVYLISKCYDARAFAIAHVLAGSDKRVGVDLFDDYFSQAADSRLIGFRHWLGTLTGLVDFVLCSTPAMRELAERLAPGLPKHVMNDPALPVDAEKLRLTLERKLRHLRESGIVNVAWFGMGDNPHFPVGLPDLVAFSDELAKLRAQGLEVRLHVLTNQRAMTADSLAMLKRLPVPYVVEDWTEERERRELAKSLVCLLPVNAQNFSIVKSLNRAVTSLGAGTQVLSSGYPLYEALAPFVYRDVANLAQDIRSQTLLLRPQSIPQLLQLIELWADPAREARSLVEFLEQGVVKPPLSRVAPAAVVHGSNSSSEIHKVVQRMGAFSVGSPFCKLDLNFDLRFAFAADGGLEVLIAQELHSALAADIQALTSPHGKIVDTHFRKVEARKILPELALVGAELARLGTPMSISASYPQVMAAIDRLLESLFPGVGCYHSEQAPIPWFVPRQAPASEREAV